MKRTHTHIHTVPFSPLAARGGTGLGFLNRDPPSTRSSAGMCLIWGGGGITAREPKGERGEGGILQEVRTNISNTSIEHFALLVYSALMYLCPPVGAQLMKLAAGAASWATWHTRVPSAQPIFSLGIPLRLFCRSCRSTVGGRGCECSIPRGVDISIRLQAWVSLFFTSLCSQSNTVS